MKLCCDGGSSHRHARQIDEIGGRSPPPVTIGGAGGRFPPGDGCSLAPDTRMEEIPNRSRSCHAHRSVRPSVASRNSRTPANTVARSDGSPHLPPALETGSANPLAAEPNPPANRCSSSLEVDARPPESSAYPDHPIRSEEPGPPSPSLYCSQRSAERVGVNLLGELLFAERSSEPAAFRRRRIPASPGRRWSQALHNHIANAGVQVESGEDPFVHRASTG